jgi:predicted ester cyclase
MSEANKNIVRRYVEAFNRGDVETLQNEVFAPDAVVQGAEGDTVAARYTERGTFVGPFRGNQPTGKSFELVAMEFFEIREGKIVRRWGVRDHASQMRQIGMPMS